MMEHAQRVIGVRGQSRALREQIEDSKLARDPGILELKIGIEIDNPIVPMNLAVVDRS